MDPVILNMIAYVTGVPPPYDSIISNENAPWAYSGANTSSYLGIISEQVGFGTCCSVWRSGSKGARFKNGRVHFSVLRRITNDYFIEVVDAQSSSHPVSISQHYHCQL